MAGLWRSGKGRITFYLNPQTLENSVKTSPGDVLFLPQRPYMVLGTLRQQLLYPAWTTTTMDGGSERDDGMDELKKPTTDDLMRTLKNVRLGHIVDRFGGLDSFHEWSSVLSLGEQQRLAFARLLLCQPKLALLDESTSALDEANEVLTRCFLLSFLEEHLVCNSANSFLMMMRRHTSTSKFSQLGLHT